MLREIIYIDREKCNGCGECIPNCHEGALQIIEGKACLVSELMCDGLGACIGHCPVGAISMETREAIAYNEVATLKAILPNGQAVVYAHLKHLIEHQELTYYKEGIAFLKSIERPPFSLDQLFVDLNLVFEKNKKTQSHTPKVPCVSAQSLSFAGKQAQLAPQKTALTHWPIQLHLIQPQAQHFKNSHLLLAADCVAFSMSRFHEDYLMGKTLCIACPKLDTNKEVYVQKLIQLIENAKIVSITVMKMEVPCCNGLLQIAQQAIREAQIDVPIKTITIGINGIAKTS